MPMGSEEAGNKILPNQKLFQNSFGEAMRGGFKPGIDGKIVKWTSAL